MTERSIYVMCRCLECSCPHRRQREFDTVVSTNWEYDHPLLAFYTDEFKAGDYPLLKSVLARIASESIALRSDEAADVLAELVRLETHRLPGTTSILVDEHGARIWPYLEPDGLDARRTFTPLYCRAGDVFNKSLIIGLEGHELVVKRAATDEEVLRGPKFHQFVSDSEPLVADGVPCWLLTLWIPETSHRASGMAEPIHRERLTNLLAAKRDLPTVIEVRQAPLTLAGTLYFSRWLKAAAEACLDTKNPVVSAPTAPDDE